MHPSQAPPLPFFEKQTVSAFPVSTVHSDVFWLFCFLLVIYIIAFYNTNYMEICDLGIEHYDILRDRLRVCGSERKLFMQDYNFSNDFFLKY